MKTTRPIDISVVERVHMRLTLLVALLLASCSKSQTPPTTTPEPTTGEQPPGPASEPDAGARPELTAAACEAQGGKVQGDIGDGAVHQPDYKCPDSGAAPIGTIVPDGGGAQAVEGAVCCK